MYQLGDFSIGECAISGICLLEDVPIRRCPDSWMFQGGNWTIRNFLVIVKILFRKYDLEIPLILLK